MFLVALLTGPAGMADDAATQARLAKVTGVTGYEARLALAGGFPAVVLTTADEEKAATVAATLRAAGDDVIACDTREVTPAEEMIPIDRFTFETEALVAGEKSLPYADLLCLLRAVHRARSSTETRTTEKKYDMAKSLFTGGLSNSKVVTKTSTESSETREPVLYVFRRSGATPWILRENRTRYEGLGPARGLTAPANFTTTVRILRERAPHAIYDERLVRAHRAPERSMKEGVAAKSTVTTSSASGVDALAFLLAVALGRR